MPKKIDNYDIKYKLSAMKRFFDATIVGDGGCVEFTKNLDKDGYGKIFYANKSYRAHRLSYMWANGIKELNPDEFICHSCDNPSCVNPEHLWLGDVLSNARDALEKGRRNKPRDFCNKGHEFEVIGVREHKTGKRSCLKCLRDYHKKYMKEYRKKC